MSKIYRGTFNWHARNRLRGYKICRDCTDGDNGILSKTLNAISENIFIQAQKHATYASNAFFQYASN